MIDFPDPIDTMSPAELDEIVESFPTTFAERPEVSEVPNEIGAFQQWQQEVFKGLRKKTDTDALQLAACYEATARDELKQGLQKEAAQSRRRAAEIIVNAVAEHAA